MWRGLPAARPTCWPCPIEDWTYGPWNTEVCFCRLWKTRQINVDERRWLSAAPETTVHRSSSIDAWQPANNIPPTAFRHVFLKRGLIVNCLPKEDLAHITAGL